MRTRVVLRPPIQGIAADKLPAQSDALARAVLDAALIDAVW
jgi:hypothetical protein